MTVMWDQQNQRVRGEPCRVNMHTTCTQMAMCKQRAVSVCLSHIWAAPASDGAEDLRAAALPALSEDFTRLAGPHVPKACTHSDIWTTQEGGLSLPPSLNLCLCVCLSLTLSQFLNLCLCLFCSISLSLFFFFFYLFFLFIVALSGALPSPSEQENELGKQNSYRENK